MNKEEPKVLTRMRLSCCWGDNLNEKELNEVVDYINSLQQENKQLKEDMKVLFEENSNKEQLIREQIKRILKAIELLKSIDNDFYDYDVERLIIGRNNIIELLEILKGDSDE